MRRASALIEPPERKNGLRARTSSGNGRRVSRGVVWSFAGRVSILRGACERLLKRAAARVVRLRRVTGRARSVAAALAVAALLVALGSGINDFSNTWGWLSDQHAQFAGLTPRERVQEPGTAQLLPVDAFDFFRSKLRDGDRYYIAAKSGGFQTGVDRAQASRVFARYYLLPAVQVDDPAEADIVFTVGVHPKTLGVRLARVEKFADGNYFAARVRG
jgi:hypothetical protein